METQFALIPLPEEMSLGRGQFLISGSTTISADSPNQENLVWLQRVLQEETGLSLAYGPDIGDLHLAIDPGLARLGPEAYRLFIREKGVMLSGASPTGVFYGIQTLRQLLPPQKNRLEQASLPFLQITDRPHFGWRGFMLDEGRHFQGIDTVKRLLDIMSALKMNIFHWHLTEDQGWRIEIKRFPRLTEVGSRRAGTAQSMWSMFTGQHDGLPHGGFYTQDQIKEIVAYAAARHITVVPEIEMPGHSVAALAAYPQFSCRGEPLPVRTAFGISKDVYCVGNEGTFAFLEGILDEVLDLFPGKYIHLGGDEAPRTRWENCPKCRQSMEAQGFSETRQLHAYLINRMAAYLARHGRTAIGWNENLLPGLDPDFIIQYWFKGEREVKAALRAGRRVIFSPYLDYYLDHSYSLTPLSRTYAYQPGFPDLPETAHENILGVEAPLWTEWVPNQARLDYQTFPRLLAVAETAWSFPEQKNWKDFFTRYQGAKQKFASWGIPFFSDREIQPGWLSKKFGVFTIAQKQDKTG